MRKAKPHELKTPAVPVLTARLTEAELSKWVPIRFEDIDDPLAVPEPSKGALIKLDDGSYVVLYYGKVSGELTIEVPDTTQDFAALLAAFFLEVPLPSSRVLWRRPDMTRGRKRERPQREAKTTSRSKAASARVKHSG
jgi:hypothetical protein